MITHHNLERENVLVSNSDQDDFEMNFHRFSQFVR